MVVSVLDRCRRLKAYERRLARACAHIVVAALAHSSYPLSTLGTNARGKKYYFILETNKHFTISNTFSLRGDFDQLPQRETGKSPARRMGPKKTEATKKPSGGKKKLSGFMLFSQKNREIVKSENPGNLPRRA
jgi:hypothetical protein